MRSSSALDVTRWRRVITACLLVAGCTDAESGPDPTTTTAVEAITTASEPADTPLRGALHYEVVNEYPHDTSAFTQGLELVDGVLVESTGLFGASDRRRVEVATGEVLSRVELDPEVFGEGVTERDGLLYQLTWLAGRLLISDAQTLAPVAEGTYDGEGWGICSADEAPGRPFVMSDGSSTLTLREPETFAVRSSVAVVADDGSAVTALNELECVGNQVLANVWRSSEIVVIDLATGQVDATIDLAAIIPTGLEEGRDVLNGIAHRPDAGTFLVTGKNWPVLYEIRLLPAR